MLWHVLLLAQLVLLVQVVLEILLSCSRCLEGLQVNPLLCQALDNAVVHVLGVRLGGSRSSGSCVCIHKHIVGHPTHNLVSQIPHTIKAVRLVFNLLLASPI